MQPGKPAARVGDHQMCPRTGDKPHIGGEIDEPGSPDVRIGGKPAARAGDMAICADTTENKAFLMDGSPSVRINDRSAVRLSDKTSHAGWITYGLTSVLIGEDSGTLSAADTLALAMIEIRNSAFAKTTEGRAILGRLEELYAAGKIEPEDFKGRLGGHYDSSTGTILFEERDANDPHKVACTLVHEGTHAAGHALNTLAEEERAFKNELDFYKESNQKTGYDEPARNDLEEARKEGKLPKVLCGEYKRSEHPLKGCPE